MPDVPNPPEAAIVHSLAELVPRAATRWPDAVALVGGDVELTWREVDRRTLTGATALVAAGVAPGDRVAIARRKTHQSFEAVHSILRAGGVVVPIDPLAPAALAREVLTDARVRAVIGDAATVAALDPWTAVETGLVAVFLTDDDNGDGGDARTTPWDPTRDGAAERPPPSLPTVGPDDVAYLIYTSGSTGRPKGIVHTHRSGLAYATRAVAEYGLGPDDRLAGMNPLHFDMSTLELYAAPLAGCTTVVMTETDLQFPASLTQRSAQHDVTVWYTVPFLLRSVVERGGLDRRPLPHLRSILYGGEPYPGAALRRLMALLPNTTVVNVYGPAEVNACTHHHIDDIDAVGEEIPIGTPWAGVEVRVVADDGSPAAVGEPGELLVSAPTAMRGYWELDDLTASRLTPRETSPPWYATGDIVVERDGTLWFRGRRDHQVKVRGVRLELEGIENVLTNAASVLHAVAGPIGPSGDATHVVAAVVLRDGADADAAELRRWCGIHLPSVAVPRSIEFRPSFPTTASGKIDRATVRDQLRKQPQD